jgi:prepilin-type N-terminal cleavage/methylation domain-containing protein
MSSIAFNSPNGDTKLRRLRGALRGFSLIELVIVVVIIGIIAAIAIPRMSRGSKGAADSALAANLAVLRNAIDMYVSEHEGVVPDAANFVDQMTLYTNISGTTTSATKNTATGVIYGPYLRTIPPVPVGPAKGKATVAAAAGAGIGWVYDSTGPDIKPNVDVTAEDSAGKLYKDY